MAPSHAVNAHSLGGRLSRPLLLSTLAAIVGFAAVVGTLGWVLRGELRAQILSRDVELLESVVALEYRLLEEEFDWLPVDYASLAVNASALRGVLAMTVHDLEGNVVGHVPDTVDSASLPDRVRETLIYDGHGVGIFHPKFELASLFRDEPASTASSRVPIVEIIAPVQSPEGGVVAYTRFWLDGSLIASEFARLDRKLLGQGGAIWFGASVLVIFIGSIGARHMRRVADQLEERTRALKQANADLELAARSSAVGAISSHLLHGLKNPLAGLGAYLRAHGNDDAREAAARMQKLVQETLSVLRSSSSTGGTLELSISECFETLCRRFEVEAEALEVEISTACGVDGVLQSREANLILLILENLVRNALDASRSGGQVKLCVEGDGRVVRFSVCDEGEGIAPAVRSRLFQPGCSSKEGGTGLGLAISRQLARAIGGELLLREGNAGPTRFDLEVPAHLVRFQKTGKMV